MAPSLDTLARWRPRSLAVTHFGAYDDVDAHLAALRAHLDEVERWAAEGDEASFAARLRARVGAGATVGVADPGGRDAGGGGGDADSRGSVADAGGAEGARDGGATAGAYGQALPAEQSFQGLTRYLSKRAHA